MSNAPQIKSIVERVERLQEEIDGLNSDKSDIFKEAKANGYDVKALKTVIARRRKDPAELSEHDAIVETYLAALESGTAVATRARTKAPPPFPHRSPLRRASKHPRLRRPNPFLPSHTPNSPLSHPLTTAWTFQRRFDGRSNEFPLRPPLLRKAGGGAGFNTSRHRRSVSSRGRGEDFG